MRFLNFKIDSFIFAYDKIRDDGKPSYLLARRMPQLKMQLTSR